MLAVESVLLLLSLIFFVYGVFIFMKIREINNFSKDLHDLLESKIRFLRFHYEIWLIITAVVVWILSFAINTLVDNQEGLYRINRVGVFVIVSLAMLAFIYVVQKISAMASIQNLKVFLADLERSSVTGTETAEKNRKKMRLIYFAAIIILTALLILGVLKGLGII
jgi:hypothetical protein